MKFELPFVDCDIHPYATKELPLAPHIPAAFREAVGQGYGSSPSHGYQNPFGVNRRDANCGAPTDVIENLFEPYGIVYGVLQPPGMKMGIVRNIDVGNALARAWNDWQIEGWLQADARLLGSICVNPNDPDAAIAEIKRVGTHPQMVQVFGFGRER